MEKWNLIIDVAQCQNCNNCLLAAKDELVGNDFPGYSAPHAAHGPGVIRIERHVRGTAPMVDAAYLVKLCNHCDDGPCLKAGGDNGAVRKRDDGIVIFDPVKAKGRRDLVESCPYGAVVWNEALQLPQTWFFDAHLLDAGWDSPRCVSVCPTRAIEAVRTTDDAMALRAKEERLRPFSPELGGKPRVHYRNLDRFDHLFVGGSVEIFDGERIDCAACVEVELHIASRPTLHAQTDAFGDFRFDGFPPGTGSGQIHVVHPQLGSALRDFCISDTSVTLGSITLKRT